MRTKQITVYLQTGDNLVLEAKGDNEEHACLAAVLKAKKAIKQGVQHNSNGLRLYPPHMIKYVEIK